MADFSKPERIISKQFDAKERAAYNREMLDQYFPNLEKSFDDILDNIANPKEGVWLTEPSIHNEIKCAPAKIVNINANQFHNIPDFIYQFGRRYVEHCQGSVVIIHSNHRFRKIHPEEANPNIVWVVAGVISPIEPAKVYSTHTGTPGVGVVQFMSSLSVTDALFKDDFRVVRIKGSHWHFEHEDGRKTTVPHPKKDLPIGTVKSIEEQTGLTLRPRPHKKKLH